NTPRVKNVFFNIFFLFCFLSPTAEIFYFVWYIFLALNLGSFKLNFNYVLSIKLLMGALIFMSFFFNVNHTSSFKDLLNVFNVLLLIFLFPYFINSEVTLK